jgi:hypothetical protein
MAACQTLVDLGTRNCKSVLEVTKMLVLVPLYGADGSENSISLTNAKLKAQWILKYNDVDTEDRFYPTPIIENVATERAASEFETLNSGRKVKLRKGQRTFTGYFVQEGATFLGKIESWEKISDFGFYIFDAAGNIGYNKKANDTALYPIPVENGSFDTMLVMPTDSAVEKIMIQFDVASYFKDSSINVLKYSDLTDFNPLTDSYALIDATVECASATTTSITFTVTDTYGDAVENLVAADLVSSVGGATSKIRNTTDAADVAVTGLTENSAGNYTATFTAQTSADSMTVKVLKNGYDVVVDTIAIP